MKDLYIWLSIAAVVLASTTADELLARAMKQIGDLGKLRRNEGLAAIISRIVRNRRFLAGLAAMTVAFYSLLLALSWEDVSLVAPASASLTFVANAVAARIFLHERVDSRRWVAALLVAGGVALVAV
jgi:drug/metabolite transporter (DMT)-like permease